MLSFFSISTRFRGVLLILLLIGGGDLIAQTGTLTGTVKSSYNLVPLAGATVFIPPSYTTTTLVNGTYSLQAPAGIQTTTYSKIGFIDQVKYPTIVANQTTVQDVLLDPTPAYLSGIIFDCDSGEPIIGAKIECGNCFTYSVAGGAYTLNIYPVGTLSVIVTKEGYDNYQAGPFTFQPGITEILNICELVTPYPPQALVGELDQTQTVVTLNWDAPAGNYELIYDDGLCDDWTQWAFGGNMNAVKFTPLGYPATILGGKVNVGSLENYQNSSSPLIPFQMAVFDDSGPGGLPGEIIGDFFDITPGGFGWVEFVTGNPTIGSGSFYLVMIQGGNAPNASGLCIDLTNPQLRSFSRDIMNGQPWMPAAGNFMIRALVYGAGGPGPMDNVQELKPDPVEVEEGALGLTPEIDYHLWRLKQGEETNPGIWTLVDSTDQFTLTDNSWTSLPCGPYRWATKAVYPGNRLSGAEFSNVIGKCWTAAVQVYVGLTCEAHPWTGTTVQLINNTYPDTNYIELTDSNGLALFLDVWKGNYTLNAFRFNYPVFTQLFDVTGDTTLNLFLLQDQTPPTNLVVDERSLKAVWNSPKMMIEQFNETWEGGYGPNQWVEIPPNSNWAISATFGNPAPSAQFNWSPSIAGYEHFLRCDKMIGGLYAPQQTLKYDIYLSNFSTTSIEYLSVEIWDHVAWHSVKLWTNQNGNIPWTTDQVDISQFSNTDFKLRFKAFGNDSYSINNWNLDNISVYSTDGSTGYNPCVLGYNFYLNNVLTGFTADTTFLIPPYLVTYGETYDACVNAVYTSGYSSPCCDSFTSWFLYPPVNLQVEPVECAAYLTWDKPMAWFEYPVSSIKPRGEKSVGSAEYSPVEITRTGYSYTDNIWDILFSWSGTDGARPGIEASYEHLFLSAWQTGYGAPPWFQKYEKLTGLLVEGFDIPGATAIRDMAHDGQYYYGSPATSTLYQMDFMNHTLVSSWNTGISTGIRHLTYDPNLDGGNGGFWGGNWSDIKAVAFNGTLLWNGPAMTNCYGSTFDNFSPNGPFLWTFSQTGTNQAELTQYAIGYWPMSLTPTGVVFDVGSVPGFLSGSTAGGLCSSPVGSKFALIADVQQDPQYIVGLEISDYNPPCCGVPGIIGYRVYRDGAYLQYVSGPDTTWYYDFTVYPGLHSYAVSAYYDLTEYGYPGQFDESMQEGPEDVAIICCCSLPFCETWDQASFAYNEWDFVPEQGNWSITTQDGNPAPAADFTWDPIRTNYDYRMIFDRLDATPWPCSTIWLDYDIRLEDKNATGAEKLTVEVYMQESWHTVAEYSNNGSFGWESHHHDVSEGAGGAMRMRFRAQGANSEDILHWRLDNICVYAVCNPPLNPEGIAMWDKVYLSWETPSCNAPGPLGELKEIVGHNGNPATSYFQNYDWVYGALFDLSMYPDAKLEYIDFHHSSRGESGIWNYRIHVVDWSTFTEVATIGPLQTTGDDKWEEGIPLGVISGYGGSEVGIMIQPMSYSPTNAYPCLSADNTGPSMTSVFGPLPEYSSLLASAIGDFLIDLWIRTNNDDGPRTPVGITYNVYRSDGNYPYNFELITPDPIEDTTYVDEGFSLAPIEVYVVTAIYTDDSFICESPHSDTVEVIWEGILEEAGIRLEIFPNPASDRLVILSDQPIQRLEVSSSLGHQILTKPGINALREELEISTLAGGVYLLKVWTKQGIGVAKIMVARE